MRCNQRSIHYRKPDTFTQIQGDFDLFQKIVADMIANGGFLAPIAHWHMVDKNEEELEADKQYIDVSQDRYEEAYIKQYQDSSRFLDAWIGDFGHKKWTEEQLAFWKPFLEQVDTLKLFEDVQSHPERDWIYTDLSTILNINVLSAFAPDSATHILEVGGGYGRLAEAALNVFEGIKYVMLDAVPGSLLFSYLYMKHQFPDKKIGFYYNGDPLDMDAYDVYICPSWHFERLNTCQYDIAINISSFQEMGQQHVDFYLSLFDACLKDRGLVYLCNSRSYVFQGEWNYPAHWSKQYMYNTPVGWPDVYPYELFEVDASRKDHQDRNSFYDAAYFLSMRSLQNANAEIATLKNRMGWLAKDKEKEKEKVRALQSSLSETEAERNAAKQALEETLQSTSWKITKPIRAVRSALGKK